MKRHATWINRFADTERQVTHALPGIPLVEIAGDKRVLIENHKGVAEYSQSRICVCVKYGRLLILGSSLELSQMSRHQLVITGCIDSVTIERSCP